MPLIRTLATWLSRIAINEARARARKKGLVRDTEDSLAARVLTLEHRLYPAVLRRFAAGDRTPVLLP